MAKYFFVSIVLLFLLSIHCSCQINEHFIDGNFTDNPVWSGDTQNFIVNASHQLQSSSVQSNISFYLSTPNQLAQNCEWEFSVEINFNPSSLNYIDVYLVSSNTDLLSANNTGYFVRIGNTLDEICLYIKKSDGTISKIIDGADGVLDKDHNSIRIKVTRGINGQWSLFRDAVSNGRAYILEGKVVDNSFNATAAFGFLIHQSTAGFFKKHYFSDILVQDYREVAPAVVSVKTINEYDLDILFDKPMDITPIGILLSFYADQNIGKPVSVLKDAKNPLLLHLRFGKSFPSDIIVTVFINGLKDESGVALADTDLPFLYHPLKPFDIIIDEIMANPRPSIGLPDAEWIEIKNTTNVPIHVEGFTLVNGHKKSDPFPDSLIYPGEFVIITKAENITLLNTYGKVLGIRNFPSLTNNSDTIYLLSPQNTWIHAAHYNLKTYHNDMKSKGGWSIEMVDPNSPCSDNDNWAASNDPLGGTPGKLNSYHKNNSSQTPYITNLFAPDNMHIIAVFNRMLDSSKALSRDNYIITDGLVITSIECISPLFDRVRISLQTPMITNYVYTLSINKMHDCNNVDIQDNFQFGIGKDASEKDIVINEILYHPRAEGAEYIELYNRSENIIDVSNLNLVKRNKQLQLETKYRLFEQSKIVLPNHFLLLTVDTAAVLKQYVTTSRKAFFEMDKMPLLSNDSDHIVLIDSNDKVIDELAYSDKWQFQLLTNTEGVSLERSDVNGPSNATNFHSASTSVGYGTPGYANSQNISQNSPASVTVAPEIISPDNDGIDDIATIHYHFDQPCTLSSITIYDDLGRQVRSLQKNALNGTNGDYSWDGLGENKQQLKMGVYIIVSEVLDTTSGKKYKYKNVIVLARR